MYFWFFDEIFQSPEFLGIGVSQIDETSSLGLQYPPTRLGIRINQRNNPQSRSQLLHYLLNVSRTYFMFQSKWMIPRRALARWTKINPTRSDENDIEYPPRSRRGLFVHSKVNIERRATTNGSFSRWHCDWGELSCEEKRKWILPWLWRKKGRSSRFKVSGYDVMRWGWMECICKQKARIPSSWKQKEWFQRF